MNEDLTLSGVFENHYTDRYKEQTPSVQEFKPEAEKTFDAGENIPSDAKEDTIGLPADRQEIMSRYRYKMKESELGEQEIDLSGKTEYSPEYMKLLAEFQRKQTPMERRKRAKEALLESISEHNASREVIDPDNIPEGSMWNIIDYTTVTDVSRRTMFEITEGMWEGFENTARMALVGATNVIEAIAPDAGSDYYKAWVDLLNDTSVKTMDIMRPQMFPDIKDQEGIGYGFVRGIAQFMPDFLVVSNRLKQLPALANKYATRGFIAGIPADYLSFDAADGNIHSMLRKLGEVEVPGLGVVNLDNEYTRFMSADLYDTQAEGRLYNAIEGGIIGVISETVLTGIAKGLGWGAGKSRDAAKHLTDMFVNYAKTVRSFRHGMARAMEIRAANKVAAEARKAKDPFFKQRGQVGDVGAPEQKAEEVKATPAPMDPEARKRVVDAYSELAFARMMKGDIPIGKVEKWTQEIGGTLASPIKGEGKAIIREAFDNAMQMIKNGGRNPFFYSKMERSILENMPATEELTGQQILDLLTQPVQRTKKGKVVTDKQGNVIMDPPAWQYTLRLTNAQGKRDPVKTPVNINEIKFSGLEAWLKINKDRVIPKDELIDMVRARRVKVDVVERKTGRQVAREDVLSGHEGGSSPEGFDARVNELDAGEFQNFEREMTTREWTDEDEFDYDTVWDDERERIEEEWDENDVEYDDEELDQAASEAADSLQEEHRNQDRRQYLDVDSSYYVRQDSDGDWEVWARNEYKGYRSNREDALREMYAYAVMDETIEGKAIQQVIKDEDGIIRSGFPSSDYSNYTFASINQYAYDDKYLVYTFHWNRQRIEEDKNLLEELLSSKPAGEIDPELQSLLNERRAIIEARGPEHADSHFGKDYAHVRVTFRKDKATGEIIPHIEELQSDYLQGFSKRGVKIMPAHEAQLIVDNFSKMQDLASGRLGELQNNLADAVKHEFDQYKEGKETMFTWDELVKLRDELNREGLDSPESLGTAITVLEPGTLDDGFRYEPRVRMEYLQKFVDEMSGAFEYPTADMTNRSKNHLIKIIARKSFVAKHFGVPDSEQSRVIAGEYLQAMKLAERAKQSINPTPFDEEAFQKQLVGAIIKEMVDRGYKKLSWARPWAESGSRNSGYAAWREVEVPEWIDKDGNRRNTAFLQVNEYRDGIWRESDLNIKTERAMRMLYEDLEASKIATLKETGVAPGGYTLVKDIDDFITKEEQAELVAGIAKPAAKAKKRVWDKMQKSRKGYDSSFDYDTKTFREWDDNPYIEFQEFQGYATNYAIKAPKMIKQVVNEFDPKAKVMDGRQALVYERENPSNYTVYESRRMYSLGDAKGVEKNPYYGMDPDEIVNGWNMSEEFFRLADVDTTKLLALKYMRYLPRFKEELPRDPAIMYYIPEPGIRGLFNNKQAAEKLIREHNSYDVQWIDLSGFYREKNGEKIKATDGGVSVLGLIPGMVATGLVAAGASGEAEAQQPVDKDQLMDRIRRQQVNQFGQVDINRERPPVKMPPPEKVEPKKVGEQ